MSGACTACIGVTVMGTTCERSATFGRSAPSNEATRGTMAESTQLRRPTSASKTFESRALRTSASDSASLLWSLVACWTVSSRNSSSSVLEVCRPPRTSCATPSRRSCRDLMLTPEESVAARRSSSCCWSSATCVRMRTVSAVTSFLRSSLRAFSDRHLAPASSAILCSNASVRSRWEACKLAILSISAFCEAFSCASRGSSSRSSTKASSTRDVSRVRDCC
mmetsp:Transcript_11700/g.36523  ORF Transcript_11700/g.36523 Transcript_11700/m.36523 type:complete len:222 (+) Transcript_11700:141-806(+)